MSNCESVNNESLDLDEREIYKHFANRLQSTLLRCSCEPVWTHVERMMKLLSLF